MSSRTATLGALLIAGAFLIAASLIPFDLTAQESDPITASCVRLTRSLYLGRTDSETNGEVTKLQRFLTQTGDFTYGHTTGYFGPLTEAAVQQWQCRNMQLCSGGPEENGWGVVGPQTRRAMRVGCDASFPPAPPPYPSNASCTLDGVTVLHGQSWTFYLTNTVQSPNTCSSVAQTRTCTNGTLSGNSAYNKASCTVAGGSVNTTVADWKFNEASGTTAFDTSGNGNHGVLENGATFYIGTQSNKLELDGVDDRMRVNTVSSNILNMESFTVAAWVRPTEYGGVIMRKGNTERGRFNFGLRSDGALYLRAGYSERTGSWQTTTTLPLNAWSRVAVTYSYGISNKPALYVNGVQQALRPSIANPGTYDPADPLGTPTPDTPYLYIGNTHDFVNRSQPGFDSAFEGRIDIVRVFNTILPASEIQSLFTGGGTFGGGWEPPSNPPPVACNTEAYAPVCAWPPGCIKNTCTNNICPLTCALHDPQTYRNECQMRAADATFLYAGACDPKNMPPVISGLSGPRTLKVNETGTWTIQASDPENGALSYHITWGDEYVGDGSISIGRPLDFTTTNTFTHRYSSAGTYNMTVTVRDVGRETQFYNASREAKFYTTVNVTN